MLRNKTVVVGVTGGIAAYKSCDVVSKLKKLGADVHVIMTESALEFVGEITFQTLSNNFVVKSMFDTPRTWEVEHISLAKKADLFLIVPATANFVGKIANGIADDMLTTTVMATKSPVMIALAMNTNMYENPIVQDNIDKLRRFGYLFVEPAEGMLACGDIGRGKLADVDEIIESVKKCLCHTSKIENDDISSISSKDNKITNCTKDDLHYGISKQDLIGKNIIITAGPTIETIDPVRYITNRSTGKMGYSIAQQAIDRGANVTLITGKTYIEKPKGLSKLIEIESAMDLYNSIMSEFDNADIVIQSAAVADYRPAHYSDKKIKKTDDDMSIKLTRNKDVAKELGKIKSNKILVGFAAETNDLLENAKKKIKKKNLDFIVANDLTKKGAGFSSDTNIVKIIDREGRVEEFPKMSKLEVANIILDKVLKLIAKK